MIHPYLYQSADELARMIRAGSASSADITRAHLDQIKQHNHKINALISIFEEEAMQTARDCDKEAREGNFRGPLHGVPVTIKEQFWIKGKHSNMNFKMLRDFVAPEDAVIVDRIRKSGAVILGQTNVPRNLTDYQVSGDLYPEGKNPYNTDYTPGGSTGGGAAAVAAGMTPLELGGDLGGSVRQPANCCGLYAMKPTEKTVPVHGMVPLPKNAYTFIVQMAQAGPLARTIEDVELLWKIIVGPDVSDRSTPDINWHLPVRQSLREYRIAWTDGWPGFETSSGTRNMISSFAGKLGAQGCAVEKRIPDETLHHESLRVFTGLFPYIITQGTPWFVRAIIRRQLYGGLLKGIKQAHPQLSRELNRGLQLNANHYGAMLLQRSLVVRRWEAFFDDYDLLICPIAFGPAFKRCKIGSKLSCDGKEMLYIDYTWPYVACFNASGHPAISVPFGLNEAGLPVGIQIVGKYWSEPELLHFVKHLNQIIPGFIKPEGY